MKIICAVLCYNSEKTIKDVLKKTRKIHTKFDFLFIDDGSTDDTLKILDSFKVKKIKHNKNKGYGSAVKSAFKYAKKKNYKYLAIFPGDNQRYIKDLITMANKIKKNNLDMVSGSKYNLLKQIPFHRKIGNIFFSKIAKILWNSKINDVLTGFKIYKIDSIYKYLIHFPNNYSFDIILNQIVSLKKMRSKEINVKCKYNKHTTSMKSFFKIHKKNIGIIGLLMILNSFSFLVKFKFKLIN